MPAHKNSYTQRTRNAVVVLAQDDNNSHSFEITDWDKKDINVRVNELLWLEDAAQVLSEASEEIHAVQQETNVSNKSRNGLTNIIGTLRKDMSKPNNKFRKEVDRLTTQKKNRMRAIVENEDDENPLNGARANLFDDEAPPAVATQAALVNSAVTPGPESNVITSTVTSTAAIDALTKSVEGAIVGVLGTMQQVVTESAAERAADRKRVNEVDEKADLANRKVDRNTEELKAVHSQVNDNTKEIVVLHRNDAVREVELRQLKHEAAEDRRTRKLAAAEDRRTRKLAAVVFPVLLAVVVGVWLCFNNDAFASSAFSGAMASHVRYIVKLAWMYLVEFVAKVETYWRAFTGNLSFWWFGQA